MGVGHLENWLREGGGRFLLRKGDIRRGVHVERVGGGDNNAKQNILL